MKIAEVSVFLFVVFFVLSGASFMSGNEYYTALFFVSFQLWFIAFFIFYENPNK